MDDNDEIEDQERQTKKDAFGKYDGTNIRESVESVSDRLDSDLRENIQGERPMTNEEHKRFRELLRSENQEMRELLAEELGKDASEYSDSEESPTGEENVKGDPLYINVGEGMDERVEELLATLDRGEEPDPHYEVVLESVEELQTVVRPESIEIIQTIRNENPETTDELAQILGRDAEAVRDDVMELSTRGIVEEGLRVWYDRIEIHLDLRDSCD